MTLKPRAARSSMYASTSLRSSLYSRQLVSPCQKNGVPSFLMRNRPLLETRSPCVADACAAHASDSAAARNKPERADRAERVSIAFSFRGPGKQAKAVVADGQRR